MKKRLHVTLVLFLALMLVLTSCAAPAADPGTTAPVEEAAPAESGESEEALAAEEAPAAAGSGLVCEGKRFGLITPVSGLGDNSIGDATYNGIMEASEKLGFTFDYSEPKNPTDIESIIIDYSKTGEYDMIFLASYDSLDPVEAVGPEYPNQKFIMYDIQAEGNEQYISEFFAKNEIGFIAGALAALLEEKGEVTIAGKTTTFEPTGKIGLIIGNEVPSTVPALTGAAAGVKYINPDYENLYGIVGDWNNQAKNKELALSMYDQGAHFIFHNSGGGAIGIVEAARERNQFFIGYDRDQVDWDPSLVIGSSVKQNSATILRVFQEYCENGGELAWGTAEENNAANGGIAFKYNPDLVVPEDIAEIMKGVIAALKNGEIKAPNTWEEVEAFDVVYGE